MMLANTWWYRHRYGIVFPLLAVACGAVVGGAAAIVVTLPAPTGSRSSFYIALYFAAIGAFVVAALLVTRAKAGLPVLLAALAFLPSRTGMQYKFAGYAIITVADLAIVLGMVVLLVQTKVVTKQRLQRLAINRPLWIWVVVGLLGILVAVARGVIWENWIPEVKAFYLWPLIAVLCVNVIRTRLTLWTIMAVAVVSALPNVIYAAGEAGSSTAVATTTLDNGATVVRATGGAGLINQFAFYLMALFFVSLAMGLATRRWYSRVFFFGSAAFLLVGIFLTYTRGAWIGTVVGLLVLGVVGGRRVLAVLVPSTIIGYFLIPAQVWARLNFEDHSVAERVVFLNTGLAALQSYPWFGAGWGSSFYLVGKYLAPSFTLGDLPLWHNDYLVVATQVGLPGLAVYLWIWVTILLLTIRTYRRAPRGPLRTYLLGFLAAMAAMMTQAFTDNFIWHNETGPLIWLLVGLMCATINLITEESHQSAGTAPTATVQKVQPVGREAS